VIGTSVAPLRRSRYRDRSARSVAHGGGEGRHETRALDRAPIEATRAACFPDDEPLDEHTWEADGVLGLTLQTIDGSDLPDWEAGAHIDVQLPSGLTRPYSLCGDPQDRTRYKIAVRRGDAGGGGSAEIHSTALVGKQLRVRPPRNHFALCEAMEHLLVAGESASLF
jgi:NAD(P)H-flavin reductase